MNPTSDPKRTCKAVQAAHDDPQLQPGGCEYGPPGLARRLDQGDHLLFNCPGCGRAGAIRAAHPKPDNGNGATWDITGGSLGDVTTLTLHPSINCVGCCGWHGWLRNGVFESC